MYTDNFDDEKEVIVQENNYGSSGNTLKIVIIIIMLIVIGGLVYFVLKGKGSKVNNNYTLSLFPESIIVPLGKNQNISYEVRNNGVVIPEATIRLVSSDENIIKVTDTIVTGVNYGKTTVTATYIDDDGTNHDIIKDVIVADGNPSVSVSNVEFPEGDLQMPLNGTYNIKLSIEPSNGYVESKKLISSDINIVSVDNSGLVTAISEGVATITMNVNGKFARDMKVVVSKDYEISRVVISPTSIEINNGIEKMTEGDKASLKYTVIPSNANIDNIKWSSSNEEVLTVDYRGTVTAKKEGTATIKVEFSNTVSDSIKIKVEKKIILVNSIDLSVTELSLTPNQSQMIVPVVNPYDATDKTLTYTVDNPYVVSITPSADTSSATVMALQAGTATITIKSNSNNEAIKVLNVTVIDNTEPLPTSSSGGSGGSGGGCSSTGNECNSSTKLCTSGKYCSCGKCKECTAGYYCTGGKRTVCPAGKGSYAGASSCYSCPKGYYSTGNGKGCIQCPSGKTTTTTGAKGKDACNVNGTPASLPTPTTSTTPKATTTTAPTASTYKSVGSCYTGLQLTSYKKCSVPSGKHCKAGTNWTTTEIRCSYTTCVKITCENL